MYPLLLGTEHFEPETINFSMKPWTHDLDSPWCCQMHGSNMLQTDAQRRHPKGPLFKGMLSPKKEGPYFSGIWWKDVRSYLQGWAPKCLHVCHVCIICWWSHYFHIISSIWGCVFSCFFVLPLMGAPVEPLWKRRLKVGFSAALCLWGIQGIQELPFQGAHPVWAESPKVHMSYIKSHFGSVYKVGPGPQL